MAPQNCRYTKEHEWIRAEGETGVIGITDHAAGELGDVTFIELPQADQEVKKGDAIGTVESVKAASEIYAPAGGTIIGTNNRLEEEPELINSSPFEDGWLVKISLSDPSELDNLMDAAAYLEYLSTLEK
jgi:glycine cleavage system H protein